MQIKSNINILYFFQENQGYMYSWQSLHIFNELKMHGIYVHVYNPLEYQNLQESNLRLIEFIHENAGKFDLFMSCEGSDTIFPDTIKNINKIGIPSILICFDNLHNPFMHKEIANFFDIIWLTSAETYNMFKNWGCSKIIIQPYAANPFEFKPNWGDVIDGISFIGTPYGSRVNKLNLLTKNNIFCNIYSNSQNLTELSNVNFFDSLHHILKLLTFEIGRKLILGAILNRYVYNENILKENAYLKLLPSLSFLEMQNVYSNSTLSLNISELRNTYVLKNPIHKLHLRTFEIPMSGGLQIVSYSEEIASYFEDEKEIILYNTDEELISKSKFYLNKQNSSIVLQMKMNARRRAETEHTWYNRFSKVINLI